MPCDLFANVQMALVLDNDTSMFPYYFVFVKNPRNLKYKVSFLDKTDLPVMTVAFHHFCTFTLQPFPLVISPMARRAIGEEFSFSVVTL